MSLRIVGRSATTPAGEQWRVGRRWLPRPLPRWRRLHTSGAGEAIAEAPWSMAELTSLDELPVVLLVGIGTLVVLVILVPLLLLGIELILLGFALAAGILARGLLGRPWVVQARPRDGAGAEDPQHAWRVVGLLRSGRVIDEVALALESGLAPTPGEATETLAPAPGHAS